MTRILILDDDVHSCEALSASLLMDERYQVDYACSASQAILLAQEATRQNNPYDIYLIDMRLGPGENGAEVIGYLKRICSTADAILFTGWTEPDDGIKAFQAGAARYLAKPFAIEELLLTLSSLENERRIQRERTWLQVTNETAEKVLGCTTTAVAGKVLTEGVLRLGFQRASLFLAGETDHQLVGWAQAGEGAQIGFSSRILQLPVVPRDLQGLNGHEVLYHQLSQVLASEEKGNSERDPQPVSASLDLFLLPLWAGENLVGLLVLDRFHSARSFQPEELHQLELFARIVAGNLERTRLFEQERADTLRLDLLQRASIELLRIINQDEEKFWLTLLTLVTAGYGLGFNRAWVFLAESGCQRLRGRQGVGHLLAKDAQRDWAVDRQESASFDTFLADLTEGRVRHTPLEELTREWAIDLAEGDSAFHQVLREKKVLLLDDAQLERIPASFLERFSPSQCAILPLLAGDSLIGLVVVDNKHNGKKIDQGQLSRLGTILNTASLVWQNDDQRKQREAVLAVTHTILGAAGEHPLRETLSEICRAARRVTGADWVIIYPLLSADKPLSYNVEQIGWDGVFSIENIRRQPGTKGVSANVLRSGPLVVNDVDTDQRQIGSAPLAKHQFIRSEGVKALIGVPIIGLQNRERLGVLFLDYCAPRSFTTQDRLQAESFANLAGVAILNARHSEKYRSELDQAERRGMAGEQELEGLQQVLDEALAGSSEDVVIGAVLFNLGKSVDRAAFRPEIILPDWISADLESEPVMQLRSWALDEDGEQVEHLVSREEADFVRDVLESTRVRVSPDGRKIYVPMESQKQQVIGTLSAKLYTPALRRKYQSVLERYAVSAAVALDHSRRQQQMDSILKAAQAGTLRMELTSFLAAVDQAARQISPDLSALALWYKNPESKRITWGYASGVHNTTNMHMPENPEAGSLVWEVMRAPKPIYSKDVRNDPRLNRRFVDEEGIVSAAALPLRVGEDEVGALFINYRHDHTFTPDEEVVFPILASVISVRVRDAIHLENESRSRRRLEVARMISADIGNTLDLDQVLQKVVGRLSKTFIDAASMVALYNPDDQVLEFSPKTLRYYRIDQPNLVGLSSVPLEGKSIAARVARRSLKEKKIVCELIPDVSKDDDYLAARKGVRSELCASLVANRILLGILVVERSVSPGFEPEDQELITTVAEQVSLAIDRARRSADLNFRMIVSSRYAWTSELAHNLNREVGRIKHYSYMLLQGAGNPDARRKIRRIQKSVDRLANAMPWYATPQQIELDAFIQQSVTELAEQQQQKITVVFQLQCPGLMLSCRAAALRIILRHMVRNAAQAMARQALRRLLVTTRSLDGEVEIQFEDSGPGVREELRPLIFQQRVRKRSDDEGGFGLLLTRQLVEDMGGHIRLLPSEPRRGARFSIRLPLRTDAETEVK